MKGRWPTFYKRVTLRYIYRVKSNNKAKQLVAMRNFKILSQVPAVYAPKGDPRGVPNMEYLAIRWHNFNKAFVRV